jgi:hypothetical protein
MILRLLPESNHRTATTLLMARRIAGSFLILAISVQEPSAKDRVKSARS